VYLARKSHLTRFLAGARRKPERSAGRGERPRQKASENRDPQAAQSRVHFTDEKRQLLHLGKTRLYQLRSRWLRDRKAFHIHSSGGDQRGSWPEPANAFLHEFVPLQTPCNFQLVADKLLRLHGLKRARSSVEAYIKIHLPSLIPPPPKKPRTYRRFRRARFGEIFQHYRFIHPWWTASEKQTLLLTLDDHSGLNIAAASSPATPSGPTSNTSAKPSNATAFPFPSPPAQSQTTSSQPPKPAQTSPNQPKPAQTSPTPP